MNVIYTAITRQYDSLKLHPSIEGVEFVAFCEVNQTIPGWKVRPLQGSFGDPVRDAKFYKVLSHKVFPEAQYSLWIDGPIQILEGFNWNKAIGFLGNQDLALFKHYIRRCAYTEAEVCDQRGLDKHDTIERQMRRYEEEGFPRDNGLTENCVILRRHTDSMAKINETWWDEICRGSKRDQLSLNYVLWKLGVGHSSFPGTILDNPFFLRHQHTRTKDAQ